MREKLRQLRKAYGYTQQALADAIGISRNHLTQIETGVRTPTLKLAIKLKQELRYPNDDLFDDVPSHGANRTKQ